MDEKSYREEKGQMNTGATSERTVSFLREERGWDIDRVREYAASPRGKRTLMIGLGALVVLLLVFVLASISLPGQLLYGVKTNVIEGTGNALRVTTESKAAYQVDLMRTRLDETKRLDKRGVVNEGALSALAAQTEKNTTAFLTLTAPSEERTLDRAALLTRSNEFVTLIDAIEEVAEENESMLAFGDSVAGIGSDAMRRLRDEIEVYVSLIDDTELHEFLSAELNEISDRVDAGGLRQETQDTIGRILGDVAEAIVDNDAAEAIEAIFQAKRLIALEALVPQQADEESEE